MKKLIILLVIVALVVIGFVVLRRPSQAPVEEVVSPGETTENTNVDNSNQNGVRQETHVVTYTDSGYSPSQITISRGDTVVWRNQASGGMWTASAMHPTHTVYPGSDIGLCGTTQEVGLFDSCESTSPGEEWSFTFSESGSWGYHNHVRASHFGRVIVEE